jgi:ribonuclease J
MQTTKENPEAGAHKRGRPAAGARRHDQKKGAAPDIPKAEPQGAEKKEPKLYARVEPKQEPKHPPAEQKREPGQRGRPAHVRIAFLGGLNEVGKNLTLYDCGDDMLLVD